MWLNAIGLGSKIPAFQYNAVDGSLLVTLTPDDLRGDLGLTPVEIEKFNQAMSFANSIAGAGGSGGASAGDGRGYDGARVMALEQENARLKAEVLDLKEIVKVLQEPSNSRGGNTQSSYAPTPVVSAVPAPSPAGYQSASTYDPYAAYQNQPNPTPSQSYGHAPPPAPAQSYGYSQAPAPSQSSYAAPPAYAPAPAPSRPAGAPILAGAAGGATVSRY